MPTVFLIWGIDMIFNKINKDIFLKWFLVVWSVFVFCFMAFIIKPARYGDGFEYIYMSESFIQHNTPDLQENDFKIAQEKLTTQNKFTSFPDSHSGFFMAENGKYYSYHFWLYSLVVSPVQSVIKAFHGNELRAFGVTNALFYIAMLWVIFYLAPQKNRFLLTGLMAFSPLIPYITWTHTEIFSATLVAMALVFWLRKNYKLSLLLSSLASCQNPPIIIFTIWVGCTYLYGIYKQYRETKKFDLFDFAITGLCALPIIFSPLFYYINFGTFNLIKHVGGSDFGLISFHRFLSFFFDLNQGAVLYTGILLFVFIYYAIKNLVHKNFKCFELVIMCLGFVVLSMTTPNWNCGTSVFLRYFVWVYPLLAFYIVQNLNNDKHSCIKAILLINMLGLCFIHNWFKAGEDFLSHRQLSKIIMSYIPSVYNPEHQIFYCRVSHNCKTVKWPVVFSKNDMQVRKVLTDKSGWEALKDNKEYTINDIAFYEQELSRFKDNQPKYVNVYGNKITKAVTILEIKNKISFNEIDKNISGLSVKEPWGRWSNAKTVRFGLKFLSLNKKSENILLKVNGRPFINKVRQKQSIKVYANNKYITTWEFKYGQPTQELMITIPTKDIINNLSTCDLRFEIYNPRSPQELGSGADSRKLAFGFETIEVVKK